MCNRATLCGEAALKLAAVPVALPSDGDPWAQFAYTTDQKLRRLAIRWEHGDITTSAWFREFSQIIVDGHIEAHLVGQEMAGSNLDHTLATIRGRSISDQESQYVQQFLFDMAAGRYDGKADMVAARMNLYLGKMRGTAGMGFVDGSPPEAEFLWILGGVEEHCDECPTIASGGPYYQATLYTTPGACDTPCLGNCKCHLERLDGVLGPGPIQRIQ